MKKTFKKIIKYFILKRKKPLRKNILTGNIAGAKYLASNGVTLTINNKSDREENEKDKIEKFINENLKNPKAILDYIQKNKTTVYLIKNANKALSFINEKEGLIYPKKGISALYLNFILNKKLSFKTKEIFVLDNQKTDICNLVYHFYNWYCYKLKLDGYENDTQEKFKNVFDICETTKINELDFEEIIQLKSAIKRDIEAIDFVKKIIVQNSVAKKNLNKIINGQSVNI